MEIIFDIGGTQTRIATVRSATEFSEPVMYLTPKNYEEGIGAFKKAIHVLVDGKVVTKVAGGFAGTISVSKQIVDAPNLPDWVQKPFVLDLMQEFPEATMCLENDAALVGLGEALAGAGVGFEIVAYITVSTGVGGARIVNGQIDRVAQSFEIGKQIIEPYNESLESLIGGRSLETKLGKKPESVTDENFWNEKSMILASGLQVVIEKWNPDVVVIGGAMIHTVGINVSKVEKYLSESLESLPVIKNATLKSLGGLAGSLAYLNHKK